MDFDNDCRMPELAKIRQIRRNKSLSLLVPVSESCFGKKAMDKFYSDSDAESPQLAQTPPQTPPQTHHQTPPPQTYVYQTPEIYQTQITTPQTQITTPQTQITTPSTHEVYQQSPESYQQTPESYQQTPESYQQTPESYQQTPVSYQQTPESYQQTFYENEDAKIVIKCTEDEIPVWQNFIISNNLPFDKFDVQIIN